ncbi:hypothetical protein IQ238_10400 [Pleurocapsales cyanobacterium LEGE 06147]|nr:hypothetical protein [Pleurocapsales cyanobacterium LEGE 06147]
MKKANFTNSSCRFCRYYYPEGRRGGTCQRLGVHVQSSWEACFLASPPFVNPWENLDEIIHLEHSLSLNYSSENSSPTLAQSETEVPSSKISIT